ncbi:hypothetical protein DPMN_050465 [Dreissena polymorpha]|uniref:Uncharacterized protein n=1 Tax=Dreissena polymorpha TaxID=45954 RepID=A0A9D4CHK7_DREPO|nr:hypothetical protein DPMN_050465 [Dreissena polymorpha]
MASKQFTIKVPPPGDTSIAIIKSFLKTLFYLGPPIPSSKASICKANLVHLSIRLATMSHSEGLCVKYWQPEGLKRARAQRKKTSDAKICCSCWYKKSRRMNAISDFHGNKRTKPVEKLRFQEVQLRAILVPVAICKLQLFQPG